MEFSQVAGLGEWLPPRDIYIVSEEKEREACRRCLGSGGVCRLVLVPVSLAVSEALGE